MHNWHLHPAWHAYVRQVFQMVGRVRDFTVEYRSGPLIAGVLPQARRLILNPDLLPVPEAPGIRLRFRPERPFQPVLRAILAHEAGHVAFSCAKPQHEHIGWLWNALEDERMERCVTRRFPELERDFTFLGDVMLERQRQRAQDQPWDLKNACLVWRFAHDRPDVPFLVTNPDVWQTQIRPLVEDSWQASAGRVEQLARQIWDLLPKSDQQSAPTQRLSADGGGMHEQQGEPPSAEPATDQPQPAQGRQAAGEAPEQPGTAPPEQGQAASPHQDPFPAPEHLPAPPSEAGPGGRPAAQPDTLEEARHELVREVAELLAPKERPGRRVRSRSTGHYDFQRHEQGHERYFRKRGQPERAVPFFLRLLIDQSASMSGSRLQSAKQLADLLIRAGETSASRVEIWGFNVETHLISVAGDPDARQKVASMGVGFGTSLGAALEEVFHQTPPRLGQQEILVILTDGELTSGDRLRCQGLLQAEDSPRLIVPLLLVSSGQPAWQELFGEAWSVTPESLPAFLRTYLATLRTVA